MERLLWTAEELVQHEFPESYLIEPVIPQGGFIFLHGKRNIGKTQLVLTITTCVAERGALFGRYPVKSQGPVVYVQADMPAPMHQKRMRRIHRFYNSGEIYFHFPLYLEITHLHERDEIVQAILAIDPVLIVWDTLAKVFHGDTNVDYSSSIVYATVRRLFPRATHLFVHHDKKTIPDQEKLDKEELFRGSGAWLDNADTGIHLSELGGGRLLITFTKIRTAPPQPAIPLSINSDTLLLHASSERVPDLVYYARQKHPTFTPQELERYINASFVGAPPIIHQLLFDEVGSLKL